MNTHDRNEARLQRLRDANRLIQIIGDHGRRFFWCQGRYARLELDRGRVFIVDDYTEARVYTHKTTFGNRWRGFSHGGTLRQLVELMRDYVIKGKRIPLGYIAPNNYLDTTTTTPRDIWGYGPEAAETVRRLAAELPIIEGNAP